MKVRLLVSSAGQTPYHVERRGAAVRIGRAADCDLVFQGKSADNVSSHHAQLELTSAGAFLSDLGSTNGTFLNDERVLDRQPVAKGDAIQLGHTGPVLHIVALDLTPKPGAEPACPSTPSIPRGAAATSSLAQASGIAPPPEGRTVRENQELFERPSPAVRPARRVASVLQQVSPAVWIGISVGVLGLIVLAVVLGMPSRKNDPTRPTTEPTSQQLVVTPTPPRADPKPPRADPKPPRADPEPPTLPNPDSRVVGLYLGPRKPPSILLQRQGTDAPWGRLKPGNPIQTGYYLLSLPGFRSEIALDSGLNLILWGNVMELSSELPVLESCIMLHVPPPGFAADLTVDRGRVYLKSQNDQATKVRLRFHREIWDVTLPERATEAVVELWGYTPRVRLSPPPESLPAPVALCNLIVKGRAMLHAGDQPLALGPRSHVQWTSTQPVPQARSVTALPDWWLRQDLLTQLAVDDLVNSEDPREQQLALALISLGEWSALLDQNEDVLDTVLTQVRQSEDATTRAMGILFLAAMEHLSHVVDRLDDHRHFEARNAARLAMQIGMSRGATQQRELTRILRQQRGYSVEKTALILRLLPMPARQEASSETYTVLLDLLNHDDLAVRDLAWCQLVILDQDGARSIGYDPAANASARQKAIQIWRQRIPEGKLPPPPVPQP
ncbi:MAG: FHA domain-containing protein [Gemmataceae bacterium]